MQLGTTPILCAKHANFSHLCHLFTISTSHRQAPPYEAKNMPVCYRWLDPVKAEIRLLVLLPGTKNKRIRCTLQVASLNTHPVFEALSYVWGDASITKP